jgi:hypothetical protein
MSPDARHAANRMASDQRKRALRMEGLGVDERLWPSV